MTGFSKQTRELVDLRSGGRCERCNAIRNTMQYHHRRPRAMGGSNNPDTNKAANCVLLCNFCHDDIESYRSWAFDFGFLVGQRKKPCEAPLWRNEQWVLLDNYGYVIPT